MTDKPEFNPMLVSCAEDMSTCTLTLGDGKGYFYNRVDANPVPPAGGEPELLPLRRSWSGIASWQQRAEINAWNAACDAWAPHVTRLQAEVFEFRTALQVANKNTKQVMAERAALQAELTKARELLKDIQNSTIDTLLHSRIDTVLSNRSAPADKAQVNPEHTLFNEIRISEPVNEDGEPTRYLITEAQLQRIRALETDKGQGEPVHECQKCWGRGVLPTRLSGEGETQYRNRCKSYAEQPAPVTVVLPERANAISGSHDYQSGYNTCIENVIHLNGVKP